MKNFVLILFFVLIIIGFVGFARSLGNSPQVNARPQAILDEGGTMYDFGTISMKNGNVSYEYKIRNTESEPIVIEKISTSCMCTTAKLIKGSTTYGPFGMAGHGMIPKINAELEPNEEAIIEVVFDPAAHGPAGIGRVNRTIFVENSEGDFELNFTAKVTP